MRYHKEPGSRRRRHRRWQENASLRGGARRHPGRCERTSEDKHAKKIASLRRKTFFWSLPQGNQPSLVYFEMGYFIPPPAPLINHRNRLGMGFLLHHDQPKTRGRVAEKRTPSALKQRPHGSVMPISKINAKREGVNRKEPPHGHTPRHIHRRRHA